MQQDTEMFPEKENADILYATNELLVNMEKLNSTNTESVGDNETTSTMAPETSFEISHICID